MPSPDLGRLAAEVGLDLVGVAEVGPTPGHDAYRRWLADGFDAGMAYLRRPDAVRRRADPREILPQARSVIVVASSYAGAPHPPLPPLHGRVSRYAWGEDYHRWLLERLERLIARLRETAGDFPCRCYVDTGPVLERAWGLQAGLGFAGKNAMLIHPRLGSYLFLGVALVGLELTATPAPGLGGCGRCTRCLDRCPTRAIVAPHRLDARRCIAYLTVEHRGPIPEALRPAIGDWLFGCDLCQEACPWNRRPLAAHAAEEPPPGATLYLPDLLLIDEATFRARFRRSPIWRATPTGLARNAAVVLGNRGDPAALPYLERAVRLHPSDIVREHARWAIERIRAAEADFRHDAGVL